MVIYEVNLAVQPDAAHDYAAWLDGHIREILRIDGFLSAEWFQVDDAGDARQWTVQYRLRDRRSLEDYLANHAARMRADGESRFGGRFTATRRVMDMRASFEKE
jgi:quinol monooxygenase YgiN